MHAGHGLDLGNGGKVKVFWFFSSEKNTLAMLAYARPDFLDKVTPDW
jgi:hypothetical protein